MDDAPWPGWNRDAEIKTAARSPVHSSGWFSGPS